MLQADGGTRTAAITGAYVALADAVEDARGQGPDRRRTPQPLTGSVAAVSASASSRASRCSTCDYPEDSTAETDMNVVMTGDGRFVEVQGTAEARAVRPRRCSAQLLDLATDGCADLTALPAGRARGRPRGAHVTRDGSCSPPATSTRCTSCARSSPTLVRRARARDRRCGRRRRARRRAGDRGDLRRERAAQGAWPWPRPRVCRRSPTTRGSPSTCSAVRPACSAHAGPARRVGPTAAGGPRPGQPRLLLEQLGDVRDEHRAAAFVCAAVLALPDGTVESPRAGSTGTLAREPRGDNGFGYDPIFVPRTATRAPWRSTPTWRRTRSRTAGERSARWPRS